MGAAKGLDGIYLADANSTIEKSAFGLKKHHYSLMHLKVYISVLKDVKLGIFADLPLLRHSSSAKAKAFSMPLSGNPGRTIIVLSLIHI